MKNWIFLWSLCCLFLACNKVTTPTKQTTPQTQQRPDRISKKDAGLDDPNNKIIGSWSYEIEGCINDKEIKENTYLNIDKSGTISTIGNSFRCNDCSQTFKITKNQCLLANTTYSENGFMGTSGPTCTELECIRDFCGEISQMVRLFNMDYTLNGDLLTIKQGENTFTLTRQK